MANISYNNIARAIFTASKDKHTTEYSALLKNTVDFLSRRRLISKSKEILSALNKIVNEDQGIVEVRVWSRDKISSETKKDLIHALKKRYGDKEFIFLEALDEKLLGGMKIEVGSELIDLTLKNRINKLQEHLKTTYE